MDPLTIGGEAMANAKDVFDDWAVAGRAEGMEQGHYPRAVQALEAMSISKGEAILDLGCGNGWAAAWLAEKVGEEGRVCGLDAAENMVSLAAKRFSQTSQLSFVQGDFEHLPFENQSFNHAFSMEALYYAGDLDQVLAESFRVLCPGGTLAVCIDFFQENPHCLHWPSQMELVMCLLSEEEWRARLTAAGFTDIRMFRCLDPRPVDSSWSSERQESERDFRERIGSLAMLATRPEAL